RQPVDPPGRPGIPFVDVDVRPADRSGLDLDQDLTRPGLGDGNLFQARPGAGLHLPERPHRRRLAHAPKDTQPRGSPITVRRPLTGRTSGQIGRRPGTQPSGRLARVDGDERDDRDEQGFATRAIHAGEVPREAERPVAPPIWLTAHYGYDSLEHY